MNNNTMKTKDVVAEFMNYLETGLNSPFYSIWYGGEFLGYTNVKGSIMFDESGRVLQDHVQLVAIPAGYAETNHEN